MSEKPNQEEIQPKAKGITKKQVNLAILAIVIILTAILIIQNNETVEFKVWFWTISSSRFLLLLLAFVLGALAAYLPMANSVRRKNKEIRELRKSLKDLQS